MNRKALFDNDRLPGQAIPHSLRRQPRLILWSNAQYVAISGFLRGVNGSTDTTSSTVVLVVKKYCVTVIIVRLALVTALIALKRTTPPWRRSVRLVGRSDDVTTLSEAHGASRDQFAWLCRRRFRLCLRGSLRRLRVAIRPARVY